MTDGSALQRDAQLCASVVDALPPSCDSRQVGIFSNYTGCTENTSPTGRDAEVAASAPQHAPPPRVLHRAVRPQAPPSPSRAKLWREQVKWERLFFQQVIRNRNGRWARAINCSYRTVLFVHTA
eukprot:scaffold7052_cov254-Pinguiococcus_pyrenoidosus.AAC.38